MCSAASLLSVCVRRRGSSRGLPRPQRPLPPASPAVLPPPELRRSAATTLESRAPSMPTRWLVRDGTFPAASPPPGGPRHVPAVSLSNKQRPALAGARGSPSPLARPCWPRARLRTQPFMSSASVSRAPAMLDVDSFQHLEEAFSNVDRMRASFELTRPREDMGCGPSEKFSTVDEFQKLSKSDLDLEEKKLSKSDSDKDYMVPMCSIYDGMHQVEQARRYSDEDVEEVCRILSSSDSWSSMQQALETRPWHFTPDLVIAIMKRCKRKGHAALKFFYWVGKRSYYMHTTDTYNLAMKLAGSAKDFKHMRHLYREMAWAECSPTVGTWNVMICQYGNAGLTEMALETFYQMKQEGFLPDRSTYNHLIMYVSRRKGRKVDAAIKIFKEMIDAGYILDSQVLCGYILALCECGILVDARTSIVSLCKQGFPVQIGYSILLRSLCRSDKKEEAVSLFDDIEKYGCSRNEYTYGSLIHALLRWDRFEDAVAKLEEMKNVGICQSTHIYTSFIVYFFQKRDVAKAMDMFKEMTENGCEPTVVTYSALIRGLMGMGMLSEAWDVLRRMKLKGPLPDFETYSMFITYLCKAGRSKDGLQLIHDMLDGGIIPSTVNFRTVVHGLNMEGKHKLADSVLQSKWHLRRQRSFSEDSFV